MTAPIPPGVEIYLVCLPCGWRGELHDGHDVKLGTQADTPEAVVAELVRRFAGEAGMPAAAGAA